MPRRLAALLALLPTLASAQSWRAGEAPLRPELATQEYWIGKAGCLHHTGERQADCFDNAAALAAAVQGRRTPRPPPRVITQPQITVAEEVHSFTLIEALRYLVGPEGGMVDSYEVRGLATARRILDVELERLLGVYASEGKLRRVGDRVVLPRIEAQ